MAEYDLTDQAGDPLNLVDSTFDPVAIPGFTSTTSGPALTNALFTYVQDGEVAGSGVYPSFLRIGSDSQTELGQGFNTNTPGSTLTDVNSAVHTHSLLLAELQPITGTDGVSYYEFRLDLNQPGNSQNITLNEFKVYTSANPAQPTDFVPSGTFGGALGAGFDLAYDLGAGNSVLLTAHNSGLGHDDYVIEIPVADFNSHDQYVTLYAAFSGDKGGFEQFNALTNSSAPVGGDGIVAFKTANVSDVSQVGETITYTEEVSSTGLNPLSITSIDDTLTATPTPVLDNTGHNIGDTNGNNLLDQGEIWQYTSTYTTQASDFTNNGAPTAAAGTGLIDNTVTFNAVDTATGAPVSDFADAYVAIDLPSISIVKDTLAGGVSVAGKDVLAGTALTWTYDVTDNGNVSLAAPNVTDNIPGVTVTPLISGGFNTGDANQNGQLDPGETWHYTATGAAVAGPYSNIGTATDSFTDGAGGVTNLDVTSPSGYFGDAPSISIVKDTLGGTPTTSVAGGNVLVGTTLTWTYAVTNNGNVSLVAPSVTDSQGVTVAPVTNGGFNTGDANYNGLLDPNETWQYTATGMAVAGTYSNTGEAKDSFTDSANNTQPLDVMSTSGYFGATPGISIDKQVSINGGATWLDVGNGNLADMTSLPEGSKVEFRVVVTNTSTGGLSETGVSVTDSAVAPDTSAIDGSKFTFGLTSATSITLADNQSATSNALILSSAVFGLHTDIAKVTGTASDSYGDTAPVTASDTANYTGTFSQLGGAVAGLTIGYWYNHHTVSEVTGAKQVAGAWHEAFVSYTDPVTHMASTVEGVLLGDTKGTAWQSANTQGNPLSAAAVAAAGMLLIPDAAAIQLINSSQTANDTRQILLSQALATQLNIDNGDHNPGGSVAGKNLVGEAVQWLEGASPYTAGGKIDANGDGVLSTGATSAYEYNTKTAGFSITSASPALTSSQPAWQTQNPIYQAADYHPVGNGSAAGPGSPLTPFSADGEGLKNALQAFNQNHLVTDATGNNVAWDQSGSTSGPYTDVSLNGGNDFWSILHIEAHNSANTSLLHGIA